MAEIKCIDVSEWQGNIDFKKVRAEGIDYAVLRAGFGRETSQVDAEFETYYKNAKAAGLKLGAYWYSYAIDEADARREAQACISILKGKSLELPVFYDMEDSSQTSLGKATLTKMAKAFMAVLKEAGYKVGVYANANWFANYLDYNSLYGNYYIWLAQYNSTADFKNDMWQYTSGGKVDGISGNVDMNIIYNAEMIGLNKEEPAEKVESMETAALQALMLLANRLGVISQTTPAVTNKKDAAFEKAISQMKLAVSAKNTDLVFIRKACQAIVDALPVVGDVNGDGKVNIRDATALQKEIAGIADE